MIGQVLLMIEKVQEGLELIHCATKEHMVDILIKSLTLEIHILP